jgi:hypothetical protein
MDGLIYKRGGNWDAMPFKSLHELADFTDELDEIVKEAVPEPPREVAAHLDYAQGKTGYLSASDLRAALPSLAPLPEAEHIHIASSFVNEDDPAAKSDKSGFSASLYINQATNHFYAVLTVEGRKLTTVEGVAAAARAAADKHAAAKTQAEEAAALEKLTREEADRERKRQGEVAAAILKADADRARERDRPPSQQKQEQQRADVEKGAVQTRQERSPSRIKRFLYDPWIIGLGTIVIGGVAVALLLR